MHCFFKVVILRALRLCLSTDFENMAHTYQVININYNRVYVAVIVSIIVHSALVAFFLSKENAPIYIENGVRAYDASRVKLSISKITPKEKEVMAPAKKPLPVVSEQVRPKEKFLVEKAASEVVEEQFQEQIPIVENATFKGERVAPVYPRRALMLKQEGMVLLKALIGINGNINDIQIITSSGYTILDKSAIDAVSNWKFEPSYINGKHSISWVKVPVEFVIK